MKAALVKTPIYRNFAQINAHERLPDESKILRFRHQLERHKLADQILTTIWLYQGAQPGAQEKDAADQDAVCAIESVDGAPSIAGGAAMSAPENRAQTAKSAQMARKGKNNGANPGKSSAISSSVKHRLFSAYEIHFFRTYLT